MIYPHAAGDRDQAIARALGTFVRDARDTKKESAEGPERAEQGACVCRLAARAADLGGLLPPTDRG